MPPTFSTTLWLLRPCSIWTLRFSRHQPGMTMAWRTACWTRLPFTVRIFSPGLGWMLTRQVWAELGTKWPEAYWDDWLREPKQRKGRHFLRPDVCRTYHFGKAGSSGGQFLELWERVKLNRKPVEFTSLNLSYLRNEEAYDRWLFHEIATAHPTMLGELTWIAEDGSSSSST